MVPTVVHLPRADSGAPPAIQWPAWVPIRKKWSVPHVVLPSRCAPRGVFRAPIGEFEIAIVVISADPLPCNVVGKGSNYALAVGASLQASTKIEFNVTRVEHGGFEPPTPCLPAKWSSFFWLRQRHFPSHRQHDYSMRFATLPRFLSGSVVNPVVNFSRWPPLPRGHAALAVGVPTGRCRKPAAVPARLNPSADLPRQLGLRLDV